MATILTDLQVHTRSRKKLAAKQNIIQAARYFPMAVDLDPEVVLGRAILLKLNSDVSLASQYFARTVTVPLSLDEENEALDLIEYICFENPTLSVEIRAESGNSVDVDIALVAERTYKPTAALYQNYVLSTGGNAIVIGIGLS